MGTSTRKAKAALQPELPVNKSELKRQLANQLTTVFIVALLCLWLAVTRSEVSTPVERGSCLLWLIASIIVFAVVFVWFACKRKRVRWPKWWWGFPFAAAAFLWVMYLILGIPFPDTFFLGLAILLLTWAVLLLLALFLIKTRWGIERKLGKAITCVIKQKYIYDLLSILVAFAGIFLGWKMLADAGVRDCYLIPLLLGGMLVFFVVVLVYACTSHSERNHN
jgi:hypothetical protein